MQNRFLYFEEQNMENTSGNKENAHGGNIYEVAGEYGVDWRELTDFSANINPLGLSPLLKELLAAGIDGLIHYPDAECRELRRELSDYLGVPMDRIIAGNGASEIIRLLFEALEPRKLYMPGPCFSEYESAADRCGTECVFHELREENGFILDVNRFLGDIPGDADTILICNPNNPTSGLVPKPELLKLLDHSRERKLRVIVDEAFIELTVGGNDNSVAGWIGQYPNLFVIRSLTKILAIPGLRLGYALGEHSVIQKMGREKLRWSVNSFACGIGRVLKEDKAYFDTTSRWLAGEKDRFYGKLAGIGKLKPYKPETNFILIKLLEERHTSASLRELLIRKGFIIRDASNFKFLNDRFIRVAVREREANDRLVRALLEVL
jgi:threonine-phosphate decarboxylase